MVKKLLFGDNGELFNISLSLILKFDDALKNNLNNNFINTLTSVIKNYDNSIVISHYEPYDEVVLKYI